MFWKHPMIRLTVLYNLPPGTDEDEFVEWRLNEHQLANASIPGVVETSFHRIDTMLDGLSPPYRFMTTADWSTREAFEKGFYDPVVQTQLKKDLKRVSGALFLVSEVLKSDRPAQGAA